jgi:hypothetical protein
MSELVESQLVNVTVTGFLIDQLIMNIPALMIWMSGLIVFLFVKAEREYRIFADNYGQAGSINFHGKKQGLPQPISINVQIQLISFRNSMLNRL